jgi:2-polyprenyl-3-methyl-5-hydroxy-6-metoxy-1,4-benzoquinol methylase
MLQVLTNRRFVTNEIMDGPDVDQAAHLEALEGLRRINRVSGTADKLLRPILELTHRAQLHRISLLDIACGGGDVPISVAIGLQRRGVQVDLTLLDRSQTAVQTASAAAKQAGILCRGIQADALMDPESFSQSPVLSPRSLSADVVTNSLFLHHIREPEQAVALLRRMAELAGRMVVISDLVRSRMGLFGAWAGCRLLSRSKIVHHDGPASVQAAWTVQEITDFAARAGMNGARIQRTTPWRMLLVWQKPEASAA